MNQNSNEIPVAREVKAEFGSFQRTFEAYKSTNDQRLREIDTRLGVDVLTRQKTRPP